MARGGHELKFYRGPPCPTFLHPASKPPLKRPYGRFSGGPPTERAACSRLLPFWTPHAVRLWGLPVEESRVILGNPHGKGGKRFSRQMEGKFGAVNPWFPLDRGGG
jgi:hypothetical protein